VIVDNVLVRGNTTRLWQHMASGCG